MEKYYKVTIPDFLLTGGDKYDFSKGKNVVNTFIPVRDALVEAAKAQKVITPKAVDYITECSSNVVPMPKPEVKPEVKPQPIPKPQVKKASNVGVIYIVKANDTLKKIGNMYRISWRQIAVYNRLANPNMIFQGQKILIPTKQSSNAKVVH